MKNKKNSAVSSGSLKYKLRLAFYLVFIIPLFVYLYLVSNYVLPRGSFGWEVIAPITISIIISFIGFFVIKRVFNRILLVTLEAKSIAEGDLNRKVDIFQDDEVDHLGEALNQLTSRIRNNIDELNKFSEKTNEINLDIQKRVVVLSSLLQISALISQGANLDEILKIITERLKALANSEVSCLLFKTEGKENFFMRAADGVSSERLLKIQLEPQDKIFVKITQSSKPLVMDNENVLPGDLNAVVYEKFGLKSMLAAPVFLKDRMVAILVIGNSKGSFIFKNEDLELLNFFANQVVIALKNDILIHRLEKLEIKDPLTGLYNRSFIHERLQEEIKRAITYHRPCALVLLNIDGFQKYSHDFGSLQTESALKAISSLIKTSVGEIDRVARIGDNEFAIVLPEKNKRRAQEVAEDIRKKVESVFSKEQDVNKRLTMSGGVSENPLDGIVAEELFAKARGLLDLAKTEGKNRIIT